MVLRLYYIGIAKLLIFALKKQTILAVNFMLYVIKHGTGFSASTSLSYENVRLIFFAKHISSQKERQLFCKAAFII